MELPLQRIARLLGRCGSSDAVLPPTALYNEGWMLRLLLDWWSSQPSSSAALSLCHGARWYSEALLPSQFLATSRGDPLAEGFTHADAIIGHFRLRQGGRGDVELLPGARQFVVVEAKMGSLLSAGTKNAPAFNQAARSVACIAKLLSDHSITASDLEKLAFYVIAPRQCIGEGAFAAVEMEPIAAAVRQRCSEFGNRHNVWLHDCFAPMLQVCGIGTLSWEGEIASVTERDPAFGAALGEFYGACLRHNPIRASST